MFFAGTWMELEAIILSKLTQEQKTKYCMFSLKSGSVAEYIWTQGRKKRNVAQIYHGILCSHKKG